MISNLCKTFFIATLSLNLYALNIEEAVDMALKNSRDLKKVSMNIEIAKNDLDEKKSSNYGSINLLASYTHYNLPRTLTPLTPSTMASGGIVPTTKDLLSVGLFYHVNLFTGFEDTSLTNIASIQKEIAKNMHLLTKEQLIYNVKSLYINILLAQEQFKAQLSYIDALEELYKNVSLRVELGSSAKIDKLKALADLNHAKSKLFDIKTNIRILKESLASLMFVDSISEIEDINIEVKSLVDKDYENEIYNTTRLKVASLEFEKQQEQITKISSLYYPKISLDASYMENGGINDSSNKESGDFNNDDMWQVGVNLKWNIFDFGKKHSLVEKTKILALKSKLDEEKLKRDLKKILVEALSKIEQNVQNFKSAKSELDLMFETKNIEQVMYDNGASDINNLLSVKARYQLAMSNYIVTKYNYQNGINYLEYILQKGQK